MNLSKINPCAAASLCGLALFFISANRTFRLIPNKTTPHNLLPGNSPEESIPNLLFTPGLKKCSVSNDVLATLGLLETISG